MENLNRITGRDLNEAHGVVVRSRTTGEHFFEISYEESDYEDQLLKFLREIDAEWGRTWGALSPNESMEYVFEDDSKIFVAYEYIDLQQGGETTVQHEDKVADQVGGNHYQKYDIQPIEAYKAWSKDNPDLYRGFAKFTAMRYIIRYQDKGGVEDLKKANWYINELIDFETELENEK